MSDGTRFPLWRARSCGGLPRSGFPTCPAQDYPFLIPLARGWPLAVTCARSAAIHARLEAAFWTLAG